MKSISAYLQVNFFSQVLLWLVLLIFPDTFYAAPSKPPAQDVTNNPPQYPVSLKQAINDINKKTNGRILSSETIKYKGRIVHRIKALLPSGKVRIFHIDAQPQPRKNQH